MEAADEQMQKIGAEAFFKFQKYVSDELILQYLLTCQSQS